MKRMFIFLMLATSITGNLFAQTNRDKTFDVPDGFQYNRKFSIDLGKNNKVCVQLSAVADLQQIGNLDSLLRIYISDMIAFKDSLSDPLSSKRIDYVIDAADTKKIRIQQFPQTGADFLLKNGEISALKTTQDTINIVGILSNPPVSKEFINKKYARYYNFTFYLNNLSDISQYTNGLLNEKLKTYETSYENTWKGKPGYYFLKKDTTITSQTFKGYSQQSSDMLTLSAGLGIQNYKNYFAPSFTVAASVIFSNRDRTRQNDLGLAWEPLFFFNRDNNNKLKTYRNDFLTIHYSLSPIKNKNETKDYWLNPSFSLGYLIHREGEFIDKNTFRVGIGKFDFKKTSIEPLIYFNNFFKGITPGIKITQSF